MNLKVKIFLLSLVFLKTISINCASGGYSRFMLKPEEEAKIKIQSVSTLTTNHLSDPEKLKLYENLNRFGNRYIRKGAADISSLNEIIIPNFKYANGNFDEFIEKIWFSLNPHKVEFVSSPDDQKSPNEFHKMISPASKAAMKELLQEEIGTPFLLD